jgi:hypothetical protein
LDIESFDNDITIGACLPDHEAGRSGDTSVQLRFRLWLLRWVSVMKILCAFVLALMIGAPAVAAQATPDATPSTSPEASPVAMTGCDGLPAYFQALADLTGANEGYQTVRANPGGVFGLPSDQVEGVIASLDVLIGELAKIQPPEPAAAYHRAYTDLIVWYRDLASAPDFNAHQRIVNRDKQLIPAISRATLAGQTACGTTTWTDAWDTAFGDDD